jgi:hypothetical protein
MTTEEYKEYLRTGRLPGDSKPSKHRQDLRHLWYKTNLLQNIDKGVFIYYIKSK